MRSGKMRAAFGPFLFLFALGVVSALFSCFTPSPLYGTWSDNLGNKITFSDDNTYTATIAVERTVDESDGSVINIETEVYSGSFSVAENVISLSTEYGLIVTEWDIRGSILYLNWTLPKGHTETVVSLTLYHN